MIEGYVLDELLSSYGVDANKIVNKNGNVLAYGECQKIKNVLEFLVCECGINPRNIEKCPSVLFYGPHYVKENYEFLKNNNINLSNVETTLHVLCTIPNNLKETYKYVLENYGMECINRTTSILKINLIRIQKIEKMLGDKSLVISAALSRLSINEILKNITICEENNIPITGSVFLKTAEELQASIDYVKSAYAQEYLVPLVVNKNVKYLQEVFPYLKSVGLLQYVIKSASILLLPLDELMERKEFIEDLGESLVTKTGRFNSIFGLSKKIMKN